MKLPRWFRVRRRSDRGDGIARQTGFAGYAGASTYRSGHKDAPLTPRARALWWLAIGFIVAAGIALIIYSA